MAPMEGFKGSNIPYRQWFYILLVATTIFRLLYIQWVDLAPDEAYYFTCRGTCSGGITTIRPWWVS